MNYLGPHFGRNIVLAILAAYSLSCVSDADNSNPLDSGGEREATELVFDPMPGVDLSASADKPGSEEECTTSCSLAKHPIPELTEHGFELAVRAYAKEPVEAPSESLETLLFYGTRTLSLMEDVGVGELSEKHLAFLRKELARSKAWVSLRMVDDNDNVRVSYGPTLVPLGAKQHLSAVGENLSAMEFNGTVMRTGVNYLWSRY